jgi:HEAT repeat protein
VTLKFLVALFVCALASPALPDRPKTDGGPKQLEDKYYLPLTTDLLLAALQDTNPQIRIAAAGMLAERLNKGAVPAILEALETETYPGARINMASFAAELGDAEAT